MRLAIYGQPDSYKRKDIVTEMIYYIERGVKMFDFLSYGDFETMVAQVLKELKETQYPDIYSIIYILDSEIEYNKSLFDVWTQFSPQYGIQEFIDETIYEDDFIYPQKLEK